MEEDLRQQVAAMRQALLDEEIVDNYFLTLEFLEENNQPGFIEDVATIYFRDTAKTIEKIDKELEKTSAEINFTELDRFFYLLKGSSASMSANKVRIEVNKTRELCRQAKLEEAMVAMVQLKMEFSNFKTRMMAYFELLNKLYPED